MTKNVKSAKRIARRNSKTRTKRKTLVKKSSRKNGRQTLTCKNAVAQKSNATGLTAKQSAFVREYLIDRNATRAAIRAGYSAKTARFIGAENLTKPNIAGAISQGEKAIRERNEISADRVVQELALLGFANLQDYMKSTASGDPYVDFSTLTREQAAALQEVTIDDFVEERGKQARRVRRVRFRLADKRAALVDLGKHLGMFKNKLELSGNRGGPIPISNANIDLASVGPEEAARIYREFINETA